MKAIAVMAHYDVDNLVDPYLYNNFDKLSDVVEKIILVSTSAIDSDISLRYPKVQVIVRDNVGYDFCSYKEGIFSIDELYSYDCLLVLNDSFYSNKNLDLKSIIKMSEGYDIFSLTASRQFAYHLQSYFLIFNKKALTSEWFFNFWDNLYHYKRKERIIFDYEIELTNSALRNGLSTGSCYTPVHDKNPCHSDYQLLFDKYSFVKIDVLRNDIGHVDLSATENAEIINKHLIRTKASYKDRLFKFSASKFITAGNNFFECFRQGNKQAKIAVILHLYYIDLAKEFYDNLSLLPIDFDLFVTIKDEKYLSYTKSCFGGIANNLFIAVSENKGRDVLPFINTMKAYDFLKYVMVLKLHSKKSKYSHLGSNWRKEIVSKLIPSGPAVLKLLSAFSDGSAGIAADKQHFLSNDEYWGCNETRVFNILEKLNVPENLRFLFFVGGTMFWFKPSALYPLIDSISQEVFEDESGQQDGTLAHVFERATCLPILAQRLDCIDVKTLSRIEISETYHNKVLVL